MTYSFSGCQWMGLSPPGFPLGRACWGKDARLWLGAGSACGAGGSAGSPTRCCSFIFSLAGNPCRSPDYRESSPRSTPIVNAIAAGSPPVCNLCSLAVGCAVLHKRLAWECIEVTGSLPACSRRGAGMYPSRGSWCSQGGGQPRTQGGSWDL